MRRLKEQVKSGEITAAEALRTLDAVAQAKGGSRHLHTTKTYRWLQRRVQMNWMKKEV